MNILREKQRAAGHHACFGGDSSSQSNQTTNQYDQRIVLGNNSIGATTGGVVNVTTTDAGAFDLAKMSVQSAFDAVKAAQANVAGDAAVNRNIADSSIAAISAAYADAKGNGNPTVLYAALAVAALVAVMALGHNK